MTFENCKTYVPAEPARQMSVVTQDGARIIVRVLREPLALDVTPMVLVHALAMNGDMWANVVDALPETAALAGGIYALDCRGHGLSTAPAGDFTLSQFVADIAEVLKMLGAEAVHLAGCSMGGTIALAFAGQFSERTQSLTVIDATAWYGPDAASNWAARAETACTSGMQSLVSFQLDRWFSREFAAAHPQLVSEAINVFVANHPIAYSRTCRMLGEADVRSAVSRYAGPLEVVVGEHDYATPIAMAEAVAHASSRSCLTVIPNTRHFTVLEAPDQVAIRLLHAIDTASRLVRT